MTDKQKLELRNSEIRSRLATLGGEDASEHGAAEIGTLSEEYGSNETRIRAFMVSGDEPVETTTKGTKETQERAELYQAASVGDLVYALVNGRSGVQGGAMAEMQKEHGLADNEIHIRQLSPETYAVTPAPTNAQETQQPTIPYVFPQSCAAFLGVDMPTVAVGSAVFPVLTKELDVRVPAENADADETTGAFSAEVLSPSRIQASFFYSREDRARFAGMDESLRENLSEGLADGLDKQIIAGTNGLLTGSNLDNHAVSTQTTYALYRNQFAYGRVDGRYASMTSDIRAVVGSETYAHAASQYRGNNDNMDALMSLQGALGGVKVSAHVPAVSGTKQNAIIRLGMRRDMVAPIWENVALVPDEVTLIKKGQIQITAIMLHAVRILRGDGFYKQQTQTS